MPIVALALALSRLASASIPPPLPLTGRTTLDPPVLKTGFIEAKNSALYSEDGKPYTFATLNSPHLLTSDPFEACYVLTTQEDIFDVDRSKG